MNKAQLDIIQQLQETSDEALNALQQALPAANKQLAAELGEFLYSLDKTSSGKIKPTIANLKKVDGFRKVLNKVTDGQLYNAAVGAFISQFSRVSKLMDLYFVTVTASYSVKPLYEAVRQANIDTTVASLLGSGLDANLKDPVIRLLKQNIAGGSDSRALRSLLEADILGTPTINPTLTRYVKQVSSDSLYQFEANYLQVVSNDLGLQHYYYQGTTIGDSRIFCVQRAGKYFRADEVKEWAELSWSGRIKGTNASNILTNRGGYGCRHLIIPVSKELY